MVGARVPTQPSIPPSTATRGRGSISSAPSRRTAGEAADLVQALACTATTGPEDSRAPPDPVPVPRAGDRLAGCGVHQDRRARSGRSRGGPPAGTGRRRPAGRSGSAPARPPGRPRRSGTRRGSRRRGRSPRRPRAERGGNPGCGQRPGEATGVGGDGHHLEPRTRSGVPRLDPRIGDRDHDVHVRRLGAARERAVLEGQVVVSAVGQRHDCRGHEATRRVVLQRPARTRASLAAPCPSHHCVHRPPVEGGRSRQQLGPPASRGGRLDDHRPAARRQGVTHHPLLVVRGPVRWDDHGRPSRRGDFGDRVLPRLTDHDVGVPQCR